MSFIHFETIEDYEDLINERDDHFYIVIICYNNAREQSVQAWRTFRDLSIRNRDPRFVFARIGVEHLMEFAETPIFDHIGVDPSITVLSEGGNDGSTILGGFRILEPMTQDELMEEILDVIENPDADDDEVDDNSRPSLYDIEEKEEERDEEERERSERNEVYHPRLIRRHSQSSSSQSSRSSRDSRRSSRFNRK